MRVLVLTGNALKDSRGEYEYNLCKHLEEHGIEVHDLALYGDNSHYCSNASMAKKPFGFLPEKIGNFFSPAIISEIKKGYDVIHLNAPFWSPIPLQVIIWKKMLNITTPLIMTTHAFMPEKQKMFVPAIREAVRHGKPTLIFHAFKCLPYRRVDKIICQSDLERVFIIKEFKIDQHEVVTIPNAVDMRRYSEPSYDFKKRNNLKRKYMILFTGQIIKLKGLVYLLQAIKILKEKNVDCDLVLATYNLAYDIHTEAKSYGVIDNIKVFTKLTEEDLISAYKSCNVFVLPSLSEGLPTVLLEAMAARKPVVSTNVGGVPYLLKEGKNGLMVNPRDPEGLADAIERLLSNEKFYAEIAENGYQTVIQEYDWDKTTDMVIEQYKSLVQLSQL